MAITILTKHDNHQTQIHLTRPESKHYAALRCVKCNKHIQWLSKPAVDSLETLGIKTHDRKETYNQR
jgi:uncharacterized protein with PIN domain